jgi:ubiquinone/menaquinone biosynthesis C-methylase UbiE
VAPTQDGIVDFFDRRAADYDREYHDATPGGYALRIRRRKVLDLFDHPGGRVLDVGCGPGVMAESMLAQGCQFWGIDPSANMIAIANSRFGGSEQATFIEGDAARLPFADAFFDAVLCMGVIDSVPDRPAAIREMTRVLRPGGTLILTFANLGSPYAWWKNYVFYPAVKFWQRGRARHRSAAKRARVRGGHVRAMYTRADAEAFLRSAGLTVTHVVPYNFNLFISPLDEILPKLSLRVTQILEEGSRTPPAWLAAGWIVKAAKGVQ